jgi:hypothetical protein
MSAKDDWLGRQGSNLGMAESKSAALPLGYAPTLWTVAVTVAKRCIVTQSGECNGPDADFCSSPFFPANRTALGMSFPHHGFRLQFVPSIRKIAAGAFFVVVLPDVIHRSTVGVKTEAFLLTRRIQKA